MKTILSCWKWIRSLHEFSFDEVCRWLETPYRGNSGFGFAGSSAAEGLVIRGTLIYSSLSSLKLFDPLSQQLTRHDQIHFDEAVFEIDYPHSILVVSGGSSKLNQVVRALNKTAGGRIQTEPVAFPLSDVIPLLRERTNGFILNGLLVNNFRAIPEVSGRYAASVHSQSAGLALVEEYGPDVSEFAAILDVEGAEVSVRASKQGAFVMRGETLSIARCCDLIKAILLELDYGRRSELPGS